MIKLLGKLFCGLFDGGADLVGVGDLSKDMHDYHFEFSRGIAIAKRFPPELICELTNDITPEYEYYRKQLDLELDRMVEFAGDCLAEFSFEAFTIKASAKSTLSKSFSTAFLHKTIAARAGLGWIGKNALFITSEYGSMVRLASVLTNAPFNPCDPINESKCGACLICTKACIAGAILVRNWKLEIYQEDFFDAKACSELLKKHSKEAKSSESSICKKCIAVCPYTKQYIVYSS